MRRLLQTASFLPATFFPIGSMLIGLRNQPLLSISIISNAVLLFSAFVFLLGFLLALRFLGKALRVTNDLWGLFLWFLFGVGYFLLASILNKPDLNTNNIYFAADSWSWYSRMGLPGGWNTGVRALHPFALLIFRPVVVLISAFTFGDRFTANLVLLSIAGGGCVFLMWKIVRLISGSEVHAVISASLLGVSASHLVFGSVIESYIFSAFFLLLFVWLLLSNQPAYVLVATSVLTFGITITNIAQQALTAIFVQRNLRRVVILFSLVVLIGAGLNVISRLIFPATEYFFLPQNFVGEQRFAQEINLKRVGLMAENLFIYNVAAPQPYSSFRNEMPRFNFLNGTIVDYASFGWLALVLWMVILSLAFLQFFKRFRSLADEKYLSIALLACIAFNFLLHLGYGTEPFLYSADWSYALVLFAAVSLKEYAEQIWFQIALLGLVMAVLLNNLWLLYVVARQVSPFLG